MTTCPKCGHPKYVYDKDGNIIGGHVENCNPPAPRFTALSDPPPFGERIKQKRATTTSDPQWEDVDNPDYWEPAAAPSERSRACRGLCPAASGIGLSTCSCPPLKPAQPSSDEARDAWVANIHSEDMKNPHKLAARAWDAALKWRDGK